jgi:radical SAM superfamily enzyme YgiQ (UPF0313 family)
MKVLFACKSKAIEVLGLMYLSAVAKQAGHEAKIVTFDEALSVTRSWAPDIIGFSVLTGDQHKVIAMAAEIRSQIKTHPVIIVGGSHATFFPQDFEKFDFINIVARGEWEQLLAELLGSDCQYPNIDSIPWPDRTDFPNRPIRDFIASRGCGNACNYCYNASFRKLFPEFAGVRTRNPKDVVAEVESVRPQFAYFQDSTFGASMKWLREFSLLYELKLRIPFHAHLRPEQVVEERARLLSNAGCVSVKIALETASDKLRVLINRGNTNNEDVYAAAKTLKRAKIALILQNILGLPTSTIEDDLATLEVNIKSRPAYAWSSIFTPYPETGLAKICEEQGFYDGDYSDLGDNFFDGTVLNFSAEYKEQVACLQRIFAFCAEMQVMPKIEDLTWKRLPKFIHNAMRKVGDERMFPGVKLD